MDTERFGSTDAKAKDKAMKDRDHMATEADKGQMNKESSAKSMGRPDSAAMAAAEKSRKAKEDLGMEAERESNQPANN